MLMLITYANGAFFRTIRELLELEKAIPYKLQKGGEKFYTYGFYIISIKLLSIFSAGKQGDKRFGWKL